ncbi:class I SAM-dependent methyltransferase [Kitasatospora azatica]|uniref:class I SAM-dependent methyltransferase n=1 Tax=Kitasatospora azatica TaxID=58347 RepID=UPI0005665C28|nr:class I SAM-dependent methyltransferase [Kitasatospora azatica]
MTTPLTELFDRHYLAFWQRELGADRLEREQGLAVRLGALAPGDRVLDVACGYGRMSIGLAAAGMDVTGVDISEQLLAEARVRAAAAGVEVAFRPADMLDLDGFSGFDCALLWFTSFGYFDDTDNERVLRQVFDCLAPGGRLLLETRHWDRMRRRFDPVTVRTAGEDTLIEHHSYDAQTGVQRTQQTLLVSGRRLERVGVLRRYGVPELRALCRGVGFSSATAYDGFGELLGPDSDRCVLVAVK